MAFTKQPISPLRHKPVINGKKPVINEKNPSHGSYDMNCIIGDAIAQSSLLPPPSKHRYGFM